MIIKLTIISHSTNVLWSELDKKLKDKFLSSLTANTFRKTGKFADLVTNLNLVRKWVTFIIVTEFWLTEELKLVLEINGYKSHIINREGWIGVGIQISYLEYISTEKESPFSKTNDSYDRLFLNS